MKKFKDTISGHEFDVALPQNLRLVGTGTRYKKVAFIELQIYCLGIYTDCDALLANGASDAASVTRENAVAYLAGKFGAYTTPKSLTCPPENEGLSLYCEMNFFKTLGRGMLSKGLKEDLAVHVADKAEVEKVMGIIPEEGITSGDALVVHMYNDGRILPKINGEPLPEVHRTF